ncbi:sentrin-specific protease 1-like [Olea europaea subsp. europaea]|uniref:Sentrin-specific protease 1-like n=1 Tax=Olea europaea subsp. europaea TaxID=158383 RepID=A0A8S0SV78_OLEEU|nr:sentrin-specific protease 1-like [Olea europaea subsp. europaea]
MQSLVSSLKSDQQRKLKLLLRMQGEIRTDMLDIKAHMQYMSDSVTTLISSSMEEIMKKFRENAGSEIVVGSGPTCEVNTPTVTASYLSATTNRLIYTSHQMHFCSDFQAVKVEQSVDSKGKAKVDSVCVVEFPCSIEPPSFDLGLGFTQPSQIVAKTSKEVEVQVESVISDFLKDTECIEQEHSPEAVPSLGLPVKRAPSQLKKKFNDKDDVIHPPFSIGQYLVGNKTWWYELVSREVSLTSSHMDACFYYIHQLVRSARDLKFVATTTDSLFQVKLKHMYLRFKDDANVLVMDDRLIDDITGARIPLSTPWAEVDLVKTYNGIKVHIGIEPFVSMLPHLIKCVGIWKKDSMELNVNFDFSLPQQKNGHDCSIYVVKYAEYMLHDDIGSMPMKFDVGRARLDVALLLFKHREIRKTRKLVQPTGGESIVLE